MCACADVHVFVAAFVMCMKACVALYRLTLRLTQRLPRRRNLQVIAARARDACCRCAHISLQPHAHVHRTVGQRVPTMYFCNITRRMGPAS